MDSTDDDFGELYVDVKVQASVPVAGDVKSCEESECATISDQNRVLKGKVKPESQGEMKKFDVVAKDSSPCVDEAYEESEYSDSDDDLNIVLKEDDSKVFPVACVSNTNNCRYVEPSKTCSFQKRRIGNWCTMPNVGMVNGGMKMDTSACIDQSLGMPQCGYNFSHPWYRTPFDVNSDVFKKKPWRNPGMDINDFFNFGFNEQSWKDYCNPLGRAIEVGGGTFERIPSADLRLPRDSDPDVVIQIPVTNDVEELSSVIPVEAKSLSVTSNEASRSGDLNSSGNFVKEEAFVGCQDQNTGSSSGEQSPPKEYCCSREVTPCDKEMIDEEKEDIGCSSDETNTYSVERESSLGEQIRFSPTPSCSVGKNEEFEDSETESSKGIDSDVQREVITPPRRTRFTEHEATNIKSEEMSGTRHSRHRRSHEYPSERHFKKIKHGIVKDGSFSPDLGKNVRSRHGNLYRESRKNWQNGPLFTLERDETKGKGFPHSNRENPHGRMYSSVDHDRHRDHRFGWHNTKESSRGRDLDHSNGYMYEARLKEYTSRSTFNLNQRNCRSSFKEDENRYDRQRCERKYGHERSHVLPYEGNKERNRYDWLREPYYQNCIPITDMDYRYRFEYSSAHGRHNPKQSHENDLHCRRRGDYEYNFHRHRYDDGVHREESRIPSELAYREMHSFAEVGRREFRGYERNEEFSEIDKRHHYTPDRYLDGFVSENDGYKYRVQNRWPSPSLSLRESWYTKGSRGDSWRDDTRLFTPSEAYDSQNNQLYRAGPRDGWTRNLLHSESIQDRLQYDDDWVRRDRRRFQLGDDIQCSMREVTYSEHPSYTDEILARDIRMPTHNRMSTKQRSGYLMSNIRETDERHHRSKRLKGDGHERQDPVNLTGRQGKSLVRAQFEAHYICYDNLSNQSKRSFSNGEDKIEQQEREKPGNVVCRSKEKATQIRDMNDKEEGEIIEEAMNVKGIEIDEERIQESLKKMEKRRERFKETEVARSLVATLESQTEPGAKTDYTDQQRPVRKRRWCAS
ncbi:unnamed protein product [Arabis nemorensis]|uniref:Pre-mRNA polyadenylation factor Fip1 domain-containing protein n=1 Tax=Arabis nemorensis TaxID=586526 RepID=A0A565B4Y0_9BRAS|nr:unnamed protein product [Arabis nemorensis]